jgi:hypothetical protein
MSGIARGTLDSDFRVAGQMVCLNAFANRAISWRICPSSSVTMSLAHPL